MLGRVLASGCSGLHPKVIAYPARRLHRAPRRLSLSRHSGALFLSARPRTPGGSPLCHHQQCSPALSRTERVLLSCLVPLSRRHAHGWIRRRGVEVQRQGQPRAMVSTPAPRVRATSAPKGILEGTTARRRCTCQGTTTLPPSLPSSDVVATSIPRVQAPAPCPEYGSWIGKANAQARACHGGHISTRRWPRNVTEAFKAKTQCLVSQYGNYTVGGACLARLLTQLPC